MQYCYNSSSFIINNTKISKLFTANVSKCNTSITLDNNLPGGEHKKLEVNILELEKLGYIKCFNHNFNNKTDVVLVAGGNQTSLVVHNYHISIKYNLFAYKK
jgi:hypothetical protein